MSTYANQLLEQINAEQAKIKMCEQYKNSAMGEMDEAVKNGMDTNVFLSQLNSLESYINSARTEKARLNRVRNEEMSWL